MIKRIHISELFLAGLVVLLVAVLLITRTSDMSGMTQVAVLGIFAAVVLGYIALIYKERPADEREHGLSLAAGKDAYIAGALVLLAGITVQSLNHSLDPWLPIALGAMVVTKSISYFFNDR